MITHLNTEEPSLPIKLDINSLEKIIRDDELIAAAKQQEKKGDTKREEVGANGDPEDTTDVVMADVTKTFADSVKGSTVDLPAEGPFITARALYVVPAKISRRRGEKSGSAYFVLTAPTPPSRPIVVESIDKADRDISMEGTASSGSKTAKTGEDTMEVDGETPERVVTTERIEIAKIGETPKDNVAPIKVQTPVYSPAEKTRLISLARLQLLQVIEALSALAERDAKTAQLYGKCQVACSVSGKVWRDKESRDRREGTIENTSDYKQFFSKQVKAAEERQNRPKPAPGGGLATGENGESNEKLAAIVLHLRAKRQEESKRQKSKKKVGKDTSKGKQQPTSGNNTSKEGSKSRTSTYKDIGKSRSNNIKGGGGGSRGKGRNTNKKSEGAGMSSPVMLKKSAPNGSG